MLPQFQPQAELLNAKLSQQHHCRVRLKEWKKPSAAGIGLNVVAFDPQAHARAEVIQMAEDLLTMAESGLIIDLTYSATNSDLSISTGFTGTDDQLRRLASVERLRHRLNVALDDWMNDE